MEDTARPNDEILALYDRLLAARAELNDEHEPVTGSVPRQVFAGVMQRFVRGELGASDISHVLGVTKLIMTRALEVERIAQQALNSGAAARAEAERLHADVRRAHDETMRARDEAALHRGELLRQGEQITQAIGQIRADTAQTLQLRQMLERMVAQAERRVTEAEHVLARTNETLVAVLNERRRYQLDFERAQVHRNYAAVIVVILVVLLSVLGYFAFSSLDAHQRTIETLTAPKPATPPAAKGAP